MGGQMQCLYLKQAVMGQINEDIFFEVKREVLDRLDLILQKVNLEIINYLRPQQESFNFIELSSFEAQITNLFGYLDRLYNSLNTSVSFSSIGSNKAHSDHSEHIRLQHENNQLRGEVDCLSQQLQRISERSGVLEESRLMTIRGEVSRLGAEANKMAGQMRRLGKELRGQLKSCRFDMLQQRVEIIAKMKSLPQPNPGPTQPALDHIAESQAQQMLQALDQILSIC